MKIPPQLKDLLPLPLETLKQLAQVVGQPQMVSALKEAIDKVGATDVKEVLSVEGIQNLFQQAGRWVDSVADPWGGSPKGKKGGTGINGTGELFSSRWTNGLTSPDNSRWMAEALLGTSESVAATRNLKTLAMGLTGAHEILVASNVSSALTALAIAEMGMGKESKRSWILPRIDIVRPFRYGTAATGTLRSPLDELGRSVHEVGSNQECTQEDFDSLPALEEPILLTTSPNSIPNIDSQGNRSAEHREGTGAGESSASWKEWCHERRGTWVEVLFDGSLHPTDGTESSGGVPPLGTSIIDRWDRGVDMILVPCDGWISGGETCLILARKKSPWWEQIQRTLANTGLEASPLSQAWLYRVLTATESRQRWEETPVGQFATTSMENLRFRGQKMVAQLTGMSRIESLTLEEKGCRIGMGVWGNLRVPSVVLSIVPNGLSPSALAEYLASGDRPIWCNVQSDRLELVLRTVDPDEDRFIVQRLSDEAGAGS